MVKLLHIAGGSMFGGGAIIICRLAEMSQKMGWQVDVLTTDPVFKRMVRERGIGVIDLDVIRREIRPLRDLRGLFRLWWFLIRNRYDIVHTHTSKGGFVGRLAARAAGVRAIIHTAHGFAFHEESPRRTLRLYTLLERIAAFACDRIATVSHYHRRWALELGIAGASKIVAIPNGISADRVNGDGNHQSVRLELGIGPRVRMLLTIGRLAEEKGLDDLLHALRFIARDSTNRFELAFAGAGPLASSLTKRAADLGIQDRVLFLGFRSDIGDLLAASDIVVLPTLREGLSISLLEAMAAGKPIITTTIGSNLEATHNGTAAMLVPTKNPKALAEAIVKLSQDDSLRQSISLRAREIFYRCYTEARMLESYRAQYLELSGKVQFATATQRGPGAENQDKRQLVQQGGSL
jgi:glycosyltransferase involved in cell wall biosynthesis